MPYPSLESLQRAVADGKLRLDARLVDHPAFGMLTSALATSSVLFTKPTVFAETASGALVIEGGSRFFSLAMRRSDFYIYPAPESPYGYEFEWKGTLARITLRKLQEWGIVLPTVTGMVDGLLDSLFPDVDVLYTSKDNAFLLEARTSTADLVLPGTGIGLTGLGFLYERSLDQRASARYSLFATVTVGTTQVAVSLKLPAGNQGEGPGWVVELDQPLSLNNGLADIAALFPNREDPQAGTDASLLSHLPEPFQRLPAMRLERLHLVFDPRAARLTLAECVVQTSGSYELFEGLTIRDVDINLFTTFLKGRVSTRLSFSGSFSFHNAAEAFLTVVLPLTHAGDWRIEMSGGLHLDRIQHLEALPFLRLADLNLPPEWLRVQHVHLDDLEFVFNPAERVVKSAVINVQLDAESQLIPGIKVKDPYLKLNLNFK